MYKYNQKSIPELKYLNDSRFAPIPPAEQGLQTVVAKPFFKVSDGHEQLEGLCFDKNGDLFFVGTYSGNIFKLEWATQKLSIIYTTEPGWMPASCKVHKNGRIFVVCLGNMWDKGCIFSINPDGSDFQMVLPFEAGYSMDDMTFDSEGGFYITDMKDYIDPADRYSLKGTPEGGVYYVSPDFKTITPVVKNLACPNGVALTPDESGIWVTEMSANKLHFFTLDNHQLGGLGSLNVAYYFTGRLGTDSCEVDGDGNVYVALFEQGRYLVFNKNGFPIGQILIPGREEGHMMGTTHTMVRPGTNEVYLTANDGPEGDGGSWLYVVKGFGGHNKMFQFQ